MSEEKPETKKASLPARAVRAVTSVYFDLIDAENVDVGHSRRRLDLLGRLVPSASRVSVEKTQVAGLNAEWLKPQDAIEGKALLYLHGGA